MLAFFLLANGKLKRIVLEDQTSSISLLETLAADALPCKYVEAVDGWRLRYNDGVTRRANSVLAEAAGVKTLAEKIEQAEAFYKHKRVLARFQVSPASAPEGLTAVLDERGYSTHSGADVQVASLANVLQQASKHSLEILVSEQPDENWLQVYEAVEVTNTHATRVRREMFERMTEQVAFAHCIIEGRSAAVGVGVLAAGHMGIFNMATRPDFRRRGAASSLLLGLAKWAKAREAHTLYLQVATENAVAHAVYERLGFRTRYAYHYREQAG